MGKKRKKKSRSRKKRERQEEKTAEEGLEADEVDAVIEVEEDVDPAELIAAAAGLGTSTTAEEAGDMPDVEPDVAEDAAAEEADTSPDREAQGPDLEADAEPETPLIGPDALVALSEFRQEGVATVPEELVLDLGDASSPEERDRLLAAALAHVEMQDAIYRVPVESGTARRWKGLLAATLFLMALFLAGLPPEFLVPEGPQPLSTTEEVRGIRQALLFQAEQIEAFRATTDRLPRSLSEVETALPGIRFVRSSDRLYQLIAYDPSGAAIVYDSSAPDPAFGEVVAPWSAEGDDS